MTKIYQKNSCSFGTSKVIAIGENLKHACCVWESQRDNNDDLWNAFLKSKFFTQDFDLDNPNTDNAYDEFIDSLSGEEMFDIMKDGKYNWYE